jgi:hypothetical protein
LSPHASSRLIFAPTVTTNCCGKLRAKRREAQKDVYGDVSRNYVDYRAESREWGIGSKEKGTV